MHMYFHNLQTHPCNFGNKTYVQSKYQPMKDNLKDKGIYFVNVSMIGIIKSTK